ncbi:MAG: flagellar motor switch protein FliN [Pseudomonadota bacterium]
MSDQKQSQDDLANEWASALGQQGGGADADWASALNEQAAKPARLSELKDDGAVMREDLNLEMILDIPVDISMEIGRTKISIRNLLQLTQGSVVELDRLAGEPLDVMVNGTLIAHGEVVVVNEKFGIRLTDVISASERIKRLK